MEKFLRRLISIAVLFLPLITNWILPLTITQNKVLFFCLWSGISGLLVVIVSMFPRTARLSSIDIKPWLRGRCLRNPITMPALLFVAAYGLATVLSIDPLRSLFGRLDGAGAASGFFILVFTILLLYAITDWRDLESLVSVFIISSIPVSVYGIGQFVLGLERQGFLSNIFDDYREGFVNATFQTHTALANFLIVIIPFTLARYAYGAGRVSNAKLRYGILLSLQVSCLLLTLSRGAWIALMTGLFVFYLASRNWRIKSKDWIFMCVGTLLFVGGYYFIRFGGVSRLFSFPDLTTAADIQSYRAGSTDSRILTYQKVFDSIPGAGLTGYGPETFSLIEYQAADIPLSRADSNGSYYHPSILFDPHNLILKLMTETGVLGLTAFLWLIFSFVRGVLRTLAGLVVPARRGLLIALLVSTCSLIVHGMFNWISTEMYVYLWINIAFAGIIIQWTDMASQDAQNG